MSEREIFWLGGAQHPRPGDEQSGAEQAFAAHVTKTCEQADLSVRRFVAAKGPFGSWLVEFDGAVGLERVIWNGRVGCLSRESAMERGGWREIDRQHLDGDGTEHQLHALQSMLRAGDV
jgi:hypothetical protein